MGEAMPRQLDTRVCYLKWPVVHKERECFAPNGSLSNWNCFVVEYGVPPPPPGQVVAAKSTFQFYVVSRDGSVDQKGFVVPINRTPHPLPAAEVYGSELALLKGKTVNANKRMQAHVRISGGGNRDQYKADGPYPVEPPKHWETVKTLSASEIWGFRIELEVESGPVNSPQSGARRVSVYDKLPNPATLYDSVQMWFSRPGTSTGSSVNLCFLDGISSQYAPLEVTEIKYLSDHEVYPGQVIESRIRIKLRPRTLARA
ncbi:hypothetical protein HRG_002632 [Hirsutella rhossiliensis]|uniref:Uncharacterized protein n=1 Tax=Hirsutella rhossiliensis TaxID=111463 RepID=A0A9P8N2R9_9HYPO|nr:uncharacterized protein HRG_02632 [Hirsutella rhossiliensis]KAH0967223.1 hypothetical protein HRG_02632 [Hirsutella rhossiliensis]